MSLKELIFGGGVKGVSDRRGAYDGSIKQFFDENGAAYPVWQALEAEAGRYLR